MKRMRICFCTRNKESECSDEMVIEMTDHIAQAVLETNGDVKAVKDAIAAMCKLQGTRLIPDTLNGFEILD